jgi:hypothetical protein
MYATPRCWALLAAVVLLAATVPVRAGDPDTKEAIRPEPAALPAAAEVRALTVQPSRVALRGFDDARQLVLTATLAGGREQDLTGDVHYDVLDRKVARVTSTGRVLPLADGDTEITAHYGDKTVRVPVHAEAVEASLPINFPNQVVPIFTKLGCNGGGCHGKASGQNGFKLSLLGFEPDFDYNALVMEARGRRLQPAAPDHSLLLRKASGAVGHGGGKRFDVDSDEYKLIRRWIAAGMPYGRPDDPTVTHIGVFPEHRSLTRNNQQQLAVYAHYSDGSVEDITRRAQYDSNDPDVAVVDADGLVRTLALSGEAAVMARYQGQVTVFRATVPLGRDVPAYRFEAKTLVDPCTHQKWQQLGIVPSGPCTDNQFVRRAYLDITGTLPTPAQVTAFVEDNRPEKRDQLVDALLETPEYAYYYANKWADILRVKRGNQPTRAYGTFAFHDWIREALAADMPYDEFAGAILGAVGDETKCPPVVWYKDLRTPDQYVDNTAQVFLGVRLACAQCHHHPYEKYSQDDYWGMAAFFGRVGRKNLPVAGQALNQQQQRTVIFTQTNGNVINTRTRRAAVMRPLDGAPLQAGSGDDPRHTLIDWMTNAKNPFFARAVVNRYWAHFFGRGIVDPLDDMRVTNPPSNPELLDALAQDFVKHGYSLKQLVRTICKSATYQLGSTPNEFNKYDTHAYARYYPKRLSAEVLFDAVTQVTGSPTPFPGLPADAHAPRRALMLPDESFSSYFLDVFGRPQRLSACECERVSEANLAQVLHLINSDEVQNKLSRPGGRADALAKDSRPDADKVDEVFLWAVGHPPTEAKRQQALAHIAQHVKDKKTAYENILWALINTKEFLFNE